MFEIQNGHDEMSRCSGRSESMTAVLTTLSKSIKSIKQIGLPPDGNTSLEDGREFFTVYDRAKSSEEGWTLLNLGDQSKAPSQGASSGQ
jgi:hypothetical protein